VAGEPQAEGSSRAAGASGGLNGTGQYAFLLLNRTFHLLTPFAMTYLLEIKKEYALPLLEVLQQQEAIELKPSAELQTPVTGKKRMFDAISVSTKGFRFNREEANER
jgi:hypothetical protein